MSSTVSLKLSSLLGKEIILSCEFEGYPPGSVAIVEEFVVTASRSFFRILFKTIPGSSEDVDPSLLSRIARFSRPGYLGDRSLKAFFRRGFPPKRDGFYNLIVS